MFSLPLLRQIRVAFWRLKALSAGIVVPDTWRSIEPADILMMCHDVDRGMTIDGKAFSQLLDPVREDLLELGYSVAVIASRYSVLTGDKAHGSPHSYNRESLKHAVANHLSRPISFTQEAERVSKRSIRFWQNLITQVDPGVILLIGAQPEVCLAASRLRKPTVELLHGFRYSEVPWGYCRREPASLPTHILALDDCSLQTFKQLEDRDVKVEKVKHPSLARHWPNSTPTFFEAGKSSPENEQGKERQRVVLVALQWGYGRGETHGGQFGNGVFPEVLEQMITIENEPIMWILRLHPVQLRTKRYRKVTEMIRKLQERTNVADFEISQSPLPALLEKVDLLLTASSGTAAEALISNVPVAFYDLRESMVSSLKIEYKDEFANGLAFVWDWKSDGVDGLKDIIWSNLSGKRLTPKMHADENPSCATFVSNLLGDKL